MLPPECLPDLEWVCGDGSVLEYKPVGTPFEPKVALFLERFSRNILRDPAARVYSDLVAFAFWCRRSNLERLKKQSQDGRLRLGLGLVFHITPANVPANSLFSLAFGLLAGNSNVLRLPSKSFASLNHACRILADLLNEEGFAEIKSRILLLRYAHQELITRTLSSLCDARVLWGGDATIERMRAIPLPVRARSIHFADRTSLCVLNAQATLDLNEADMQRLAEAFYNDAFLMDQNACSSPHLICWIGNHDCIHQAKSCFWPVVERVVQQRYHLEAVQVMDKFSQACREVVQRPEIKSIDHAIPEIYRLQLSELPRDWTALRGQYGYFYEVDLDCRAMLFEGMTPRVQTITYYGFEPQDWHDLVLKHKMPGIDRIVPIGKALDMDLVWDGYVLSQELSRVIAVQ